MKRVESECVDCGFPCRGKACPYFEVTHFYCDKCKEEKTLYHHDDSELCIDCIAEDLEVVEGSDV